jgi:hypothetical protein
MVIGSSLDFAYLNSLAVASDLVENWFPPHRDNSGADLTFAMLPATISRSERQIQSSTIINIFQWSFDSNIRNSARSDGVQMLESDHCR